MKIDVGLIVPHVPTLLVHGDSKSSTGLTGDLTIDMRVHSILMADYFIDCSFGYSNGIFVA